jgi:hypothetical protein
VLARLALLLGGSVAVLITPAFALSYFLAYGVPGESPPDWLAQLEEPLTGAGLLQGGSAAAYDRYGQLYLVATVLAVAGLAALLLRRRPGASPGVRRAWAVLVAGLGLVELGILGDYAIPNDVVGGVGFVLTGVGFLVAAAGCGMLGRALRRDRAISPWSALGVGALGPVSVLGGMALVGHIPSGPGLGFALAATVLGVVGVGGVRPPGSGLVTATGHARERRCDPPPRRPQRSRLHAPGRPGP